MSSAHGARLGVDIRAGGRSIDSPQPPPIRLPASITRADAPAVAWRCLAEARRAWRDADVVICDAAASAGELPTVDVVARIAAGLHRHRRRLRLEHATPELLDLLELCGLRDLVTEPDADDGDQAPEP